MNDEQLKPNRQPDPAKPDKGSLEDFSVKEAGDQGVYIKPIKEQKTDPFENSNNNQND